jgi:hypothetical protein
MKHALIGIGIFAVSAGVGSANAQTYGPYDGSRAYTSRAYGPKPRRDWPGRSAHYPAESQSG